VKSGRLELNDYLTSVSTRPYMPPAIPPQWPALTPVSSHDAKCGPNMLEGNR